MIITVLTLVNRSVIIAGQFNIGADDNLSNCKHMKSSQSVQIALWMCFAIFFFSHVRETKMDSLYVSEQYGKNIIFFPNDW